MNASRRLPAVLLVLLLSTVSLSLLVATPAMADTPVDCSATPCLVIAVLFSVAVFRERGGARPGKLLDRLLPR